jgi:hypothetical protein
MLCRARLPNRFRSPRASNGRRGLFSEPGFHPEARYELRVHFDGADYEELTFRVAFTGADADGRQALRLHTLTGEQAREESAEGALVLEGVTGEVAGDEGTRIWAGRIADPFYIDLSLLAIINGAVKNGSPADLSGWRPDNAQNSFASTHVDSVVLEVSHQHPQLQPGARTGVWCATKLATDAGGWRQINRFGHPMMWPIFWPDDTEFTNPASTRHAAEDFSADGADLARQIAAVIAATGTSDDPQGYGQAVARELFPDVQPYVVGTPAAYGFAGFNGADPGRQRPRSHAVPGHEHGRALRAQAIGGRAPAGQQLPLCRAVVRGFQAGEDAAAAGDGSLPDLGSHALVDAVDDEELGHAGAVEAKGGRGADLLAGPRSAQ